MQRLAGIVGVGDPAAKTSPVLVEEISRDLRSAAGLSFRNQFRQPHAFPYKQMLIDVGDKMAPGLTFLSWTPYRLNDRYTEEDVETTVWGYFEDTVADKVLGLSTEKKEELRTKTEADLRNLGYGDALISQVGAALVGGAGAAVIGPTLAYSLALSTASGLAWAKLWWAGSAPLAWLLGVGTGVFALLYLPVLAWWLGSPAYRKTIPATLYLIQVRKLREIEREIERALGSR